MDLNKVAVTLYDVFGYLLPGYVALLALSIIESTFVGTWLLSLSLLSAHALPFAVVAYFLGQLSHAVAAAVTESRRHRALIQAPRGRLSPKLSHAVRSELARAYGSADDFLADDDRLEAYLLADAYVSAAGSGADRDVLVAREGFFKQSIVAFVLVAAVLTAGAVAGGIRLQPRPGAMISIPVSWTAGTALSTFGAVYLLRLRFGFYHRIKLNNTLLLFLAIRARERAGGKHDAGR